MTRLSAQDQRRRARMLSERHGISEEQALRLLAEHGEDDAGLDKALRNLAHFLRAPS